VTDTKKPNLGSRIGHIIDGMKENTEQNWVQRVKQGEPAAVAELFRLYWRAARAAAFGVTGDFALAEDAASEAFYAAIESLPDLRDAQRFGPWLRTIVVRTARKQKAKTSKEKEAKLQTQPDTGALSPGADLERRELVSLIHEAVGASFRELARSGGFVLFRRLQSQRSGRLS